MSWFTYLVPLVGTDPVIIRRSGRKCQGQIIKEDKDKLEKNLLSSSDDHLDLEIKEYTNKGRGISTKRDFLKGEFVAEYAGNLIDLKTAKKLETTYAMDPKIGCYMYYFRHNNKCMCIDATDESERYGRLINHSMKLPNCLSKVVILEGKPRLIFVAKTDIAAGTELLYDYGDKSKNSVLGNPWLLS